MRIFVDHSIDESYTPQRLRIRCGAAGPKGHTPAVVEAALHEPRGWQTIWLPSDAAGWTGGVAEGGDGEGDGDGEGGAGDGVGDAENAVRPGRWVWRLSIDVLSNHQNGRDTHVRQVRLMGDFGRPRGLLDDNDDGGGGAGGGGPVVTAGARGVLAAGGDQAAAAAMRC